METLIQDVRYGLRVLTRRPGFTLVAILALALGIGANTGIFSVVNGVLLRPLNYKQPDRLVRVFEKWAQFNEASFSFPDYRDFRDKNSTLQQLAAYRPSDFTLTGSGSAERVQGREVTANFFSTLGVAPLLGVDFRPEDDQKGAPLVTILANGFWKTRFNGDRSMIGRTISLDGLSCTVVGVLPSNFHFYNDVDLFVPMNAVTHLFWEERAQHPGIHSIGRLKPGVSINQARADLKSVASALAAMYPDSNGGHSITMTSLYDNIVGDVRKLLLILMAAVLAVLLIACANVANLLLAKAATREREMAVRTALGAGRLRIVRQLLTESIVLGVAGGLLGVGIAWWGTHAVLKLIPDVIPRPDDVGVDGTVLVFALGASILTGLFFGLAPALQASNPDLNSTLKDAARGSTGTRHFLRDGLVVFEIAVSLSLVICAGLLVRSFIGLKRINPGFDPQNALSLQVALPQTGYSDGAKIRNFYHELLRRVRGISGVKSAGFTTLLPLNGDDSEGQFYINGRPVPPPNQLPLGMFYITSPGYTEAMQVPLLEGRTFDERDTTGSQAVALIDRDFKELYFKDEDPIGKHFTLWGGPSLSLEMEIVGVVGHVKQENLNTPIGSEVDPQYYMPFDQIPDAFMGAGIPGLTMVVRTATDPSSYVADIRGQVQSIDRDVPIYATKTMSDVAASAIAQQRLALMLLGTFAGLALLLASIGVYGVMSYGVAQRTHEIGIRMALGADRSTVLGLVVGGALKLAAIGVALGLVGSLLLTHFVASLLYGVTAHDTATFTLVPTVLIVVAALASYVPARKATRVDPMIALRYQ